MASSQKVYFSRGPWYCETSPGAEKMGKCAFTQIRLWKEKWGNMERGGPRKDTVDPALWKLKNKVDPWPLVTITHLCCNDLRYETFWRQQIRLTFWFLDIDFHSKKQEALINLVFPGAGARKETTKPVNHSVHCYCHKGFWVNFHWDYFSSWFRGLGSQSHHPLCTQCAMGGHTAEEFHLPQSQVLKESRGRQTMVS